MTLAGSVTANAEGATFTFPDGLTTRVTGLFGVTDSVHTVPHSGADLGLWKGTPVPSLMEGACVYRSRMNAADPSERAWAQIFGNSIIIDNGKDMRILMAHFQLLSVEVGESVAVGQIVGVSGDTGYYGGVPVDPHLHIGLARTSINPWFNKDENGHSVARLLDPLAHLSPIAQTAGPLMQVAEPDPYVLLQHAADYQAGLLMAISGLAQRRAPKFVFEADGRAAAEAVAAIQAAIDKLP